MLAGPEAGGRFGTGKPPQLDYTELQTTAQVQVTKLDLGLTQNTLEVPFTQLGGNPWKYQASPSKPELGMTLLSGINYPDSEKSSKLEQEQYEKLLKEIPLRMSMELRKQKKIPLSERDPNFLVLDLLIRFLSQVLAWSHGVAPITPEMYSENTSKMQAMPSVALNNWLEVAEETIGEWNKYKRSFDNEKLINEVIALIKKLNTSKGSENKKILKNIIIYIENVIIKYRLKQLPNINAITGGLLESLLSILMTISQEDTNKGNWVLEQIKQECCPYSNCLIKSNIQKVIGKLVLLASDLSLEQRETVKSIATAQLLIFNGSILAASGFAGGGKEQNAVWDLPSKVSSLSAKLAIHMLVEMRIFSGLAEDALNKVGINGKLSMLLSTIIQLINVHVMILAASRGSKVLREANSPFEAVKKMLVEAFEFCKSCLDELEDKETKKQLALAVRQGELAMQKRNMPGYLEALNALLNFWQIKIESIEEESEKLVNDLTKALQVVYQLASQNRLMTVVSQAA